MEKQKQSSKWERTEDIVGHRPLFSIDCQFCDRPMIHRYSQIMFDPKLMKMTILRRIISKIARWLKMATIPNEVGDPKTNTVEYKCTLCGVVDVFDIMDDKEYLQFVLDKRNDIPLYYPPAEEWAGEDEEVRKKLESLGYV